MRGSSLVRLHNRRKSKRRGNAAPSCLRRAYVLLCTFVGAASILTVAIVSVVSRKQSKNALLATSNALGVSEKSLVELGSIPLNILANPMYRDGKIEGIASPGLTERPEKPIVIGYAVSLIKCSDKQSFPAGLVDAALVLRHSVHLTSVRHSESQSKYDYQMIVIVHTQADREGCAKPLADAGFQMIVKDPPVKRSEIQGEFLRKNIHREWCCGEDEFIKLHAYTIEDVPIVVHVDLDVVFLRPMDDLFDAMLYSKDCDIGRSARVRIPVEFPTTMQWPDQIDTFMTRDWPQVMPGRKPGFQAGLLVTKPNRQVFDLLMDVIRKGDYIDGFSRENGWGGMGYGGFVGAKAMQGLLAYVYDVLLYDTWVELNQCRFNHMGMDVLYRNMPSFYRKHVKVGKCRNDRDYCEDCMATSVADIYNVHYNQCRKPWNCIGEGSRAKKLSSAIPEDQVHLNHCLLLLTKWHDIRTDLETSLLLSTSTSAVKGIERGRKGQYKKSVFQGHCTGYGGENYLSLVSSISTTRYMSDLYKTKG